MKNWSENSWILGRNSRKLGEILKNIAMFYSFSRSFPRLTSAFFSFPEFLTEGCNELYNNFSSVFQSFVLAILNFTLIVPVTSYRNFPTFWEFSWANRCFPDHPPFYQRFKNFPNFSRVFHRVSLRFPEFSQPSYINLRSIFHLVLEANRGGSRELFWGENFEIF